MDAVVGLSKLKVAELVMQRLNIRKDILVLCKTVEESIEKTYRNAISAIPAEERWRLDSYEPEDIYPDDISYRTFFNEIDLPPATEKLFDKFAKLHQTGESFFLALYDMSDQGIGFNSEEDVEAFCNQFDCAPMTLFENKDTHWVELWSA